jgi:alkanesulfonate monooxygenase
MLADGLSVFSTCPESRSIDRADYRHRVAQAARWSEAIGCEGMLVYSENGLVDPWLTAQVVVEATEQLEPLVAVQPLYMHPFAVAKMVSTLAYLYGRRTQLNLVAGGFRNDLKALGDETPHDERYERIREYAEIVRDLAAGAPPITRTAGRYRVEELRLQPPVPAELQPRFMLSGSSSAGLATAAAIGATAVRYPRPPGEDELAQAADGRLRQGIRLGLIARDDEAEAWRVARARFPVDRVGEITHRLAMSVSDSHWHGQLSRLADQAVANPSAYWLGPFQNYATFCPYLVGDYETVAHELGRYLRHGFDTVILDVPPSLEELEHIATAIRTAALAVG